MKLELTKDQAIMIAESGIWKDWTDREKAEFQLYTRLLCMPFDVFHKAVEKTLGRPVYTHEFASSVAENLREELRGERPAPSMEEILNLIPKDKLIVLKVEK